MAGQAPLANFEVPVQLKLSALWIATMFVYVYVDILAFYKPGTVRDILDGRVWEFDITQGWALGVLVLMTVPSLMVALSVLLPPRANRRTNLIVAALFAVVSFANPIGESWGFIFFGAAVELVLVIAIFVTAWRWPRAAARLPAVDQGT